MRQFCVLGPKYSGDRIVDGTEGTFELEGLPLRYAVIETEALRFDPDKASNADKVFLKVRAFSCNYRDRALALHMTKPQHQRRYLVIGSEFVGEVLAVGRNVKDLKPGDRVIGNGAYPASGVPGVLPGLPTNQGSREFQILHRQKLLRVPETVPDDIAAGFAIGGQTVYSMIRRLDLQRGDRVLVTSAKSNTSLFAICALQNHPVEVWGLSRSERHHDKLMALGLRELIVIDPGNDGWSKSPGLMRLVGEIGGFTAVIDPFSDAHIGEIANLMAVGGRYVTCGIADQHSSLIGSGSAVASVNPTHLMGSFVTKNISIIGNCLGQTSDLQAALNDCGAGQLPVPVHSRITPDNTEAFLSDTYLNKDRFGKVIFEYDRPLQVSATRASRRLVAA